MPTIACHRGLCNCPDGTIPDFPIENLSAEAPDERVFISNRFGGGSEPNIGGTYRASACGGLYWVRSTVSQEQANMMAAQLDLTCPDDPPQDGQPPTPDDPADDDDDGDGDGGGGGGGGETALFYSAGQSCSVPCPGGDLFTHTLAPGAIVSDVSQADANLRAQSECERQAWLLRMCLSPSSLVPTCVGSYFEAQFSVVGGTAPISFTIDPVSIPGGMTLFNGLLSGVPTTAGSYPITVFATDSSVPPRVITKTYTLSVAQITTAGVLPSGALAIPYSATLSQVGAPAGSVWSVTSGSLPPGLSLDPLLGVISGAPTTAGTYTFEVTLSG